MSNMQYLIRGGDQHGGDALDGSVVEQNRLMLQRLQTNHSESGSDCSPSLQRAHVCWYLTTVGEDLRDVLLRSLRAA